MVKHGFILGWVIAWVLVSYWKQYIEPKVGFWWSIAFFFFGLVFGTIIQTVMDRAEKKRKMKKELKNEEEERRY